MNWKKKLNNSKNIIIGVTSGFIAILLLLMLFGNIPRDKDIDKISYTKVGTTNSYYFNYVKWFKKQMQSMIDKGKIDKKPINPTPAQSPKPSTPKSTIAVVLPTLSPTVLTPQPTAVINSPTPDDLALSQPTPALVTPIPVTPTPILTTPLPTPQVIQPTMILPTATLSNTQTAVEINAVETGSNTDNSGILTMTYKLDENQLRQKLNNVQAGSTVNVITPGSNTSVSLSLSGEIIKDMETKDIKLSVNTGNVNYVFPATGIKVDDIAANVALRDVDINVTIKPTTQAALGMMQDIANKEKFKIEVNPVNTSINAIYGTTVKEVNQFSNYISTLIRIPDNTGTSMITTAVTSNTDGSIRHIPTDITLINDKYYAKVNSLTNTVYTLIWNPKEFGDMAGHWSRLQVNEMYSRKVINGTSAGTFEPDRSITRAEFATIVVKALGLEAKGANSFNDVKTGDWFYGYVGTANNYGIILGIGSGLFEPQRSITRQEAMAMVQRAAKIAGMNVSVSTNDITSALSQFTDKDQFSSWAQSIAAFNIRENFIKGSNGLARPLDKITRAETTVIIMRMLQRSNLIDSRTKA